MNGVSFHRGSGKWSADVKANRKTLHLGLFDTALEAAKVYNAKAQEMFGDFAKLNIV